MASSRFVGQAQDEAFRVRGSTQLDDVVARIVRVEVVTVGICENVYVSKKITIYDKDEQYDLFYFVITV